MGGNETFFNRNKKKGVLAAAQEFVRRRQLFALLLSVVLAASIVFVSPSSWITRVPGGERVAAGVAWAAGKIGIDVSRWGLAPDGRQSYAELIEAFRAAKTGASGGMGVGWGPFFSRPAAGAGTQNSLDLIKGSAADLEAGISFGKSGLGENKTIKGVLDPADPEVKDGTAVALADGDVSGEREQGGLRGDAASGAYAKKGFFNGRASAAGAQAGDLARSGLQGVGAPPVPASRSAAAANGRLSAKASNALQARAMKGFAGASSLTARNQAFTQLAEGSGRAQLGLQNCQPPACPPESAAKNTSLVFDGRTASPGFLGGSDPGGNASGSIGSSVDIPQGSNMGTAADPGSVAACEAALSSCESGKVSAQQRLLDLQSQLTDLMTRMSGACGDSCHCGPCNDLRSKAADICAGADYQNALRTVSAPCALPANCGAMGIMDAPAGLAGGSMCRGSFGTCGPTGTLGALRCLIGS